MNDKTALADLPLSKLLSFIGAQAVCFTAFGAVLWAFGDRPLGAFITTAAWEIGYGVALAGVLIAIAAALSRIFPAWADWLVRSQAGNYPFLKQRLSMAAIIFISICAGLGEEALFRGGVQVLLGDYLPVALAILIASCAFALIHFAQPVISAMIFLIGAIFGLVYWQTGSLLTVVIGHAVYDVYALWALQEGMHRLGVFDDPGEDASPVR